SLAQCERANNSSEHQSIPPSPLTPTPHLEQPRGTPHGASPTFSFPTRSAPPSELRVENLKNETKPFNTEWEKKIKDELRE
ncbi:hypothetical protein K443DRAFT_68093, partial [Laccaria amethystina LaAM-08-1]